MMFYKKIILFFVIYLSVFTNVYGSENLTIYLLRAPCSGSHWFFYLTNTLFEKNILTDGKRYLKEFPPKAGGNISAAHNPYDLHFRSKSYKNERLIVLVRNYRECMLRNYRLAENVKNEILYQASYNRLALHPDWVFNLRMNHYFHNLRVFELWNPEKRLMVYYEELLTNPRKVISQIAAFIGESSKQDEIDQFVENLEEHSQKSLAIYEGTYISHSKGKSLLHHSEKIGRKESRKLDQLVRKHFPYFLRKYLSAYPIKV